MPAAGALVNGGQQWCTGTLIGPRKVLTAAHCLEGVSASSLQFITGDSVSTPATSTAVASIHMHPEFNSAALENDIGLMILASDLAVTPMEYGAAMDASWVGRELLLVGYGVDNGPAQTGAGPKRAVRVVISQVDAKTLRYENEGGSACNGDSGGPAFYEDGGGNQIVVGVTSYGDMSCAEFGVYTRVDAFLDFVNSDPDGGGGGGDSCMDPCADSGFAVGECRYDAIGMAWQCEADGCIYPVADCGGGGGGGACMDACADYGFAVGECLYDSMGMAWQCEADGCIYPVYACGGGGGGPACDYPCEEYGLFPGECGYDSIGQAWECFGDGCIYGVLWCS